jgi:hypothetical protein
MTVGRFSARPPFPDNTDRNMLENFVKINQFPRLVKQQVAHFNYSAEAPKRPVKEYLGSFR